VLEETDFPVAKLLPLASSRSVGLTVEFKNQEIPIQELTENIFEDEEIDIALFSAGGSVSARFAPHAAKAGAVVVDNTSHFRMDENTPLVVPEVNPQDISLWQATSGAGKSAMQELDNLRVGAATNAVKIALEWIKMQEQP